MAVSVLQIQLLVISVQNDGVSKLAGRQVGRQGVVGGVAVFACGVVVRQRAEEVKRAAGCGVIDKVCRCETAGCLPVSVSLSLSLATQ